jgi:hypothetical protein
MDGKRKEHVLLQFPPMKSNSTPIRCQVCSRGEKK